jgi:hypothetical protein
MALLAVIRESGGVPRRRVPSIAPTEASVRFGKYLWSRLPRDTSIMRKRVGGEWLTHEVVRTGPVAGPMQYEHIIPVLVFALRHRIHGEDYSGDDVHGCMVTHQEHQSLLKLRTAPNVLIPALACERNQLLDVCLRRYTESNVKLIPLANRVRAPRRASPPSL